MIYSRFGSPLTIVCRATIAMQQRDGILRAAQSEDGWVLARRDDGSERVYGLGELRADGGSHEIADAIRAAEGT